MNSKKKYLRITTVIMAAYAAVLALLLASESKAEGSSIHSIGDAVWYSIITLTTVGYGDISPVTAAGKVLGILLALCSLGLFAALIGVLMSFINGQAMPRMRLRSSKDRKWYAVNEENAQSAVFASSVLADDPGAMIVFRHSDQKCMDNRSVIRLDCSPEELADIKDSASGIKYFCMGGDSWNNYRQAMEAAAIGIDTFCLTDLGSDAVTGKLHTVSRKEIISRNYWRDHPVRKDEKTIVLIGSGEIAAELLERGLLTNVFEPGRYITYHVFDRSSRFSKTHPEAVRALCGGDPDNDALFLHDDCWEYSRDIIRSADRIIICEDDDKSDLRIYEELVKLFPTAAEVHVRLNADAKRIISFGSDRTVFNVRSFIRDDINRLAATLNDIYNEGQDRPAGWEELSDHLKRSNIAVADHMIVKARFLLDDDSITDLSEQNCRMAYGVFCKADPKLRISCMEMEHRRWMRFYQMYNWKYGPEKDELMRCHPMMLPYKELNETDKEKDAFAWEMFAGVAGRSVWS